ncbi:hypothetical protein JRO89_XS04G0054200 [Xanthoceras sorbifolium]|uniref:Uncharacterized protein n=1 Tax=Xanthoceras sorbifolium TaxID=99658 RepID=A0ABQ8I477_9ROSI|nr:hypothetical protein JRO89_XS04G0054200 [Xanthoceras sorbifolium]
MDKSMLRGLEGLPEQDQARMASMIEHLQLRNRHGYHMKYLIFDCIIQNVTGEPLIQRKDDTAAVLKSRLEAFHRQTESVCFLVMLGVVSDGKWERKLPKILSVPT